MVTPRISFEFFPPQSLDASFRLWETVQALAPMKPSFVSVTYGAGGTTRTLTHEAVSTIHRHYRLPVAAHLTCVDATQTETLAIAESYAAAGLHGGEPLHHDALVQRLLQLARVRRHLRGGWVMFSISAARASPPACWIARIVRR